MNERDKLRKLLDDKDDKIVKLRDEIVRLTSILKEMVPKEVLEKESKLETEQMMEEGEENSIFKLRMTELERIKTMNENLKKQLDEVACLKDKISQLERDLQDKKTEIDILLNQNKYLRSGISTLERKLTRSNITIESLKRKINEIKSPTSIKKASTIRIEQPICESETKEHEHCKVSEEREYLLESLKERNDQIIQYEEALRKVNLELEKTTSRVHALEQELRDLANMLIKQEKGSELQISKEESSHSGVELSMIRDLINKAVLEKEELMKQIETKAQQIKDLKLKVRLISRELRFEKDKILVETEPLKAEIERLKQELEISRIESNKLLEKLMQEKDSLNQCIEDKDKHIEDLKHKIRQISHEVSYERNRVPVETESLEKEIQQSKQELDRSRIESNKLLEKLMEEKDELSKNIAEKDKQIEFLKSRLRQVSDEVDLETDKAVLEAGLSNAGMQHLRHRLEKLDLEREHLNQVIDEKNSQIGALTDDYSRLLQENKEYIKKIEELERKLNPSIDKTAISKAMTEEPKWEVMGEGKDHAPPPQRF